MTPTTQTCLAVESIAKKPNSDRQVNCNQKNGKKKFAMMPGRQHVSANDKAHSIIYNLASIQKSTRSPDSIPCPCFTCRIVFTPFA